MIRCVKVGVRPLTGAGAIVSDLRPILWDNRDGTVATGLGAQQVAAVMARHGLAKWSGYVYREDEDRHSLGYTAFIGLLVAAHQEKDARIAGLEEQYKEDMAQLESRLARLEGLLSR